MLWSQTQGQFVSKNYQTTQGGNAQTIYKRPPGRAPKGKVWDQFIGDWVSENKGSEEEAGENRDSEEIGDTEEEFDVGTGNEVDTVTEDKLENGNYDESDLVSFIPMCVL